jgi:hypothetical protein
VSNFKTGDLCIVVVPSGHTILPSQRSAIGRIGTLIARCPIWHGLSDEISWQMSNIPYPDTCCIREIALRKIDGGFDPAEEVTEEALTL